MSTPDNKPLTPVQKRILVLMLKHGKAVFGVGARHFSSGLFPGGGVVINAYQGPEYFLRLRGLIERIDTTAHWYRLTTDGKRRAQDILTKGNVRRIARPGRSP